MPSAGVREDALADDLVRIDRGRVLVTPVGTELLAASRRDRSR